MKSLTIASFLVLCSGCASLPPADQRQTQFVDSTSASKTVAYKRALAEFSKGFNDANRSLQLKDEESGQIVAKGNISCDIFRQPGDVNEYSLAFVMDFQAKDKKARFKFTDMVINDKYGQPVTWEYNQLTDSEKVEKAKECLKPLHENALKAIGGSNDF